ncbi:hypothetical protein CWIS_10805 [Cellulomonas sp. A375-1]|uniref:DUF2278 domain-containing protein n=1 Tax=Cellulomonas gelida TaxID=1712 RepID=A0A4Y3KIG5_9CELL|nr:MULTISPECIES: DUF2278 family protein [Cellulomonas]KMM45388.1 hypothetical protein CWIS_10805 [Cellulomonas sp. A375-1]MCR6705308.1 YukJ family protein [Cellulomonas sp.]GEA84201.1 hypothetical protein CGE01nite_14520 [Cellulomonas gelida]GGL19248.1 hypothetical protein GCM10009774_06960 [Cellulomonas gelida]
MPLEHGYGVLVGTLTSHERDTPDNQGRWFHVNLQVQTPAGSYRCAVDVDSAKSAIGVQWRTFGVSARDLGPVATMTPGFHFLASNPTSGAVDLIRHPAFRPRGGCLFVTAPPAWLQAIITWLAEHAWTAGDNVAAATALESVLQVGARTLVFGEPFTSGLGVHNIHQNQGDPAGSQWWDDNAIWQDGATLVLRPDGGYAVFVSKFSSQSSATDADGHPL